MRAIPRLAASIPVVLLLASACVERTTDPPARASAPGVRAHPSAAQPSHQNVPSLQPGPAGDPATPRFHGAVGAMDPARLTFSWHEGCPVAPSKLRLLTLDHWGFDGGVHRGEMVVNAKVARDVVQVFSKLFDAGFPIARMELVDEYGGDDDRSMAADNTSAFNCRAATGHPGVWSEHSFGWAVDINPLENPYVSSTGSVAPPAGSQYVNRGRHARGMIVAGDPVVRAFDAIEWGWGGRWTSIKDYQHFSLTGN